jgi:HEPN domain-containing protein
MDEVTQEVVRQWLHKADNDLKNISNNLVAVDVPTDTVCFHAQQAVEKLIKAVLVANGRDVYKTHDLVKLLGDVVGLLPGLASFEEQFEEISEYGVGTRYPDGFCDPTLEEALHAYDVAQKVKTIILDYLKL